MPLLALKRVAPPQVAFTRPPAHLLLPVVNLPHLMILPGTTVDFSVAVLFGERGCTTATICRQHLFAFPCVFLSDRRCGLQRGSLVGESNLPLPNLVELGLCLVSESSRLLRLCGDRRLLGLDLGLNLGAP